MIIQSIGIDIAKAKFDVAFLYENHSSVAETFSNDGKGVSRLITKLKEQGTGATVPCVLESTGIYHLPAALMLTNAGFRVNCINPLITKKYQRSSVRNAKTDTIDASRLAEIGIQEANLSIFKADLQAIEAKKLVSYISFLEVQMQQMKASFKAVEEMEKITGLKIDLSSTKEAIKYIQKQIDLLTKNIVERTSVEAHELANETKGLSKEKISVLLAMIGDKDFPTRDQLVAFVGLDVTPRQSGTWKGKGRLSKRGNAYARKILFQIAWGLKQHHKEYKKRYEELRQNGKDYRTTLIILARKFLRFLFAKHWKPKLSTI